MEEIIEENGNAYIEKSEKPLTEEQIADRKKRIGRRESVVTWTDNSSKQCEVCAVEFPQRLRKRCSGMGP